MKTNFICIILFFCLVACEKGANYNSYIDNKSSYNVSIIYSYKGSTSFLKDTILVKSKTYQKVEKSSWFCPDHGITPSMSDLFDTCYVVSNDTIVIVKEIHKKENWTEESGKRKYNYTFTLVDSDFKKK